MFGRAIWDKWPEFIFENFEVDFTRMIYPKNPPNHHTRPKITLYWNQYILTARNYKSVTGPLQNNFITGATLITINRLIKVQISIQFQI